MFDTYIAIDILNCNVFSFNNSLPLVKQLPGTNLNLYSILNTENSKLRMSDSVINVYNNPYIKNFLYPVIAFQTACFIL